MALSTAANMCKKLPSDAADFVMEAVPLLTNLLQYHDAKVNHSFYALHFSGLYFSVPCVLVIYSFVFHHVRCWSTLLFV